MASVQIHLIGILEIAFLLDVQASVLESHLLSLAFYESITEALIILDIFTPVSYLKQIGL